MAREDFQATETLTNKQIHAVKLMLPNIPDKISLVERSCDKAILKRFVSMLVIALGMKEAVSKARRDNEV